MSSTIYGTAWKAEYGEISEQDQFRVGRAGLNTWDATFPIVSLGDLYSCLATASTIVPNAPAFKTSTLQVRAERAGLRVEVIVEQRLDTGTPASLLRFGIEDLADLLSVVEYLKDEISTLYPNDWDFSKRSDVTMEDVRVALGDPDSPIGEQLSAKYVSGLVARGAGIDPTGVADSTTAIQAMVDSAATFGARCFLPPGTYLIDDLTLGPHRYLGGQGADSSRFGSSGITTPRVFLKHVSGTANPMITVNGGGISLEGIEMQGNGNPNPLLYVEYGFELRMRAVRMIGCPGTAFKVRRANNTFIDGVMVDNCGSATEAAVVIMSPTTADAFGETNTFDARGLTIERSANVALDVGYGDSRANGYYAEFVRLTDLHVEAANDNGGSKNTDALVRFGNVRHVVLVSPFIYGGDGPLIEHTRTDTTLTANLIDGVYIIGGALLGANGFTTPHLIHLVRGNDFSLVGTRAGRFGTAVIKAEATYGDLVKIDPTSLLDGPAWMTDSRTTTGPTWVYPGSVECRAIGVGGNSALNPTSAINGASGGVRRLTLQTAGVGRWFIQASATAESGGNAGSDLEIIRRADDGANLGAVATFYRASGTVAFNGTVAAQAIDIASTALPAASATYRGQIRMVEGGSGVADALVVCVKDTSGAYAWRSVTLI